MLTVLCIDRQILALREAVLRAERFEVFIATDGRSGITLANQHKVDVVVLDYSMPDMNGEQVARVLKRQFPHVRIVLCSGYGDIPESVFKLVDAFVTKGDAPEFLVATIKTLIGRKKPPCPETRLNRTG